MPFIFIYKDRYKIIISYLCCFLIFCPNNSSLSLFHHLSAVQETFLLVKIFCVFIFLLFHISPLLSPYLPSLPPSPSCQRFSCSPFTPIFTSFWRLGFSLQFYMQIPAGHLFALCL